MAVAKRMFKKYTERLVRSWTVPAATPELSLVRDAQTNRYGITLASAVGTKVTKTLADGSVITKDVAGVGFRPGEATVAVDGSWLFEIAGLTAGETVGTGATGTARGTAVYVDSSGALSLTKAGNTFVGEIDDCNIVGGVAAVQIGVTA